MSNQLSSPLTQSRKRAVKVRLYPTIEQEPKLAKAGEFDFLSANYFQQVVDKLSAYFDDHTLILQWDKGLAHMTLGY